MSESANQSKSTQPIDRLASALIVLLTVVIGFLIWGGSGCEDECLFHTGAKVNHFSWHHKTISGRDRAFIMTFNRPMERLSVEKNLTITPPIPGKISWSGLRLAYTLDRPIPYGETYQISLSGARDRFPNQEKTGAEIQPFRSGFSSRDRAFAYIGTEGEEQGRLILYNWTRSQKTILTPQELTVFDFKPYPQGDFLLFSAAERERGREGIRYLQLYKVPAQKPPNDTNPQIQKILDNQEYQNNKFDISQDGKTIAVQRLDRSDLNNYGLWKVGDRHNSATLITNEQVGDFLITPDSQAVAVAQGEGIALLPLQTQAQPIDFLPRFGQVLDFTPDGMGAVMIDYNTDSEKLKYTQSLIYVNNQGVQKELFNTDGSIQKCKFSPTAKDLYCWLTELEKKEEYREKPYLAKINLATKAINPLVTFAVYQESQISIASDGLGILFERSPNNDPSPGSQNKHNSIWLAIPDSDSSRTTAPDIERLPFVGFHPQWLP